MKSLTRSLSAGKGMGREIKSSHRTFAVLENRVAADKSDQYLLGIRELKIKKDSRFIFERESYIKIYSKTVEPTSLIASTENERGVNIAWDNISIKLSAGISPIIIELYFVRSLVSDDNMGSVSFDVADMYKSSLRFRSERPAGGQEPGANSIMRWLNIKANDASLSAELLIELRPLKKEEEMKEKRHLIEVAVEIENTIMKSQKLEITPATRAEDIISNIKKQGSRLGAEIDENLFCIWCMTPEGEFKKLENDALVIDEVSNEATGLNGNVLVYAPKDNEPVDYYEKTRSKITWDEKIRNPGEGLFSVLKLPEEIARSFSSSKPSFLDLKKIEKVFAKQDDEWLLNFLEGDGMKALFSMNENLENDGESAGGADCQTQLVECLKTLLNKRVVLDAVLKDDETIDGVVRQACRSTNVTMKTKVYELLAALCVYSPQGLEKVSVAFQKNSKFGRVGRFFPICRDLLQYADSGLRTALLVLINSIIQSQASFELRIATRKEFFDLGVLTTLQMIEAANLKQEKAVISRQLQVFQDSWDADFAVQEENYEKSELDLWSIESVAAKVIQKFQLLEKDAPLLLLFQQLLFLAGEPDASLCEKKCNLFTELVSEVSTAKWNDDFASIHERTKKIIDSSAPPSPPSEEKEALTDSTSPQDESHTEPTPQDDDSTNTDSSPKDKTPEDLGSSSQDKTPEDSGSSSQDNTSTVSKEPTSTTSRASRGSSRTSRSSRRSSPVPPSPTEYYRRGEYSFDDDSDDETPKKTSPRIKAKVSNRHHVPAPPPPQDNEQTPPEPAPSPPPAPSPNAPPPPPPPASAPAPPPPPGGSGAEGEKKAIRLKPFYWSKITERKAANTVWVAAVDGIELPPTCLPIEEIQKLFPASRPKQIKKKNVPKDKKPKLVTLIDPQRSNNVSILLAQFSATPEVIIKDVLSCNESLTLHRLQALQRTLPSNEELDLVNQYKGEVSMLGPVESFFLQVSKVPKFDVLVGQLAFRLQFAEMYNDSEKRVSAVSSALSDMKIKTELHTLLKIILDVGNTLNERTCYGEAKGFRLSSLRKLRDAKSTTQPRITLLHFLADVVSETHPECLPLSETLQTIMGASKVSLMVTKEEIFRIINSITDLKKDFDHLKGSLGGEDVTEDGEEEKEEELSKSTKVLTSFLSEAEEKSFALLENFKNLEKSSKEVLKEYGEPLTGNSLNNICELFAHVSSFAADLDTAVKENQDRRKREKQSERTPRSFGKSKGKEGEKEEVQRNEFGREMGALDLLLDSIRSGDFQLEPVVA